MINYVDFLKLAEKLTKRNKIDGRLKAVLVKGGVAYATDGISLIALKGLKEEQESELVKFNGFSGSKYPENVVQILSQTVEKVQQEYEIVNSSDTAHVRLLRDMVKTFKGEYFKIWAGKDGVFMGFEEEGKTLKYRISPLPGKNEELYFNGGYLATLFDFMLKASGPITISFTGTLSPILLTRGNLTTLLLPIRRF